MMNPVHGGPWSGPSAWKEPLDRPQAGSFQSRPHAEGRFAVERERAMEAREPGRHGVGAGRVGLDAQPAASAVDAGDADRVERGLVHAPPHVVLALVALAAPPR